MNTIERLERTIKMLTMAYETNEAKAQECFKDTNSESKTVCELAYRVSYLSGYVKDTINEITALKEELEKIKSSL
jgi:archaellum component FlaC